MLARAGEWNTSRERQRRMTSAMSKRKKIERKKKWQEIEIRKKEKMASGGESFATGPPAFDRQNIKAL